MELRYRAWDRVNKEMVYDIQMAYDDQYGDFHERCFWDYLYPGEGNEIQYDIMQYIGKRDKNGKEIYEGDVVEEDGLKGVVKWNKKHLKFQYLTYYKSAGFYGFNGKIIGNIYETPELLK